MPEWTSAGPSILAAFIASLVEFVEALTIVLAVGAVRGWRSALLGTAASLAALMLLDAVAGPALARIPLPVAQLVVGTLLLLFGMRWLRKAVLRAAGILPMHDEGQAFAAGTEALRRQGGPSGRAIDAVAFATAFKIVMLEGIEVVFIVIAIGASGRLILPASIGAGLALLVVVALGVRLHRPLSNVPENALKFGVGVMLAAFGTFWAGEGIGLSWPGEDWAILALIGAFVVFALAMVHLCRRLRRTSPALPNAAAGGRSPARGRVAQVAEEVMGFFVDDGWLAIGVVAWMMASWEMGAMHAVASESAGPLFAVGLTVLLAASAVRRARA
ncbi:MAG: COG4280 domain-containing protein [Cupriavidus necator]